MSQCGRYRNLLIRRGDGVLSEEYRVELESHLRNCPECQSVAAVDDELRALGAESAGADELEFRLMRREVLARTGNSRVNKGSTHSGRLTAQFRGRFHPALRAAAVILLATGIFLTGRWSGSVPPAGKDAMLGEILESVKTRSGPDSYWEAPFTFSNASFRPRGDGRIHLSFDVCRRMDLVTTTESPLAREVLVHAILDSRSLGHRLKALDFAGLVGGQDLKKTLIYTLHQDPELAVRLKALELIERMPMDMDIEQALLATLRQDRSVQMRMMTLAELVRRRMDSRVVRATIQEGRQESDPALLLYASELFGASVTDGSRLEIN